MPRVLRGQLVHILAALWPETKPMDCLSETLVHVNRQVIELPLRLTAI
jgi:hypothetical protein